MLDQIQSRIRKLQQQAESIIAKQASSVLNDIRALMERHGLTTADIDAHAAVGTRKGRAQKPKGAKVVHAKGKLPPKYRDPKTGATWSGHARPPEWIKQAKDRTVFLINGAGATASVVSAKASGKKAAVHKRNAKKAASSGAVATPHSAAKQPKKKRVAEKKAAVDKIAAKKTAAKKTAAKKTAAKKTAAKKTAAKKTAAKKTAAKKTAAKKTAAKKTAAKKAGMSKTSLTQTP
ncbi:H-NS histone family protein [Paraburkholderia hayleyella]|uniref:H-NS histone family protein n=1 Tax=Paraburkholderia hayleyella TaxID=2152889 RepID=UPI001FE5D96A|nr:H-NS histone family protein [Paraburkholderia hayleyella]